jgi:hypothetical protein
MKTPKLEKNELGEYPNSIASMVRLDAEEKRAVRRTLAESEVPMHISEVSRVTGITKLGSLSDFISNYLTNQSLEVELAYEPNRKGTGKRFIGFLMNSHGRDLYKNIG